LELLSLQGFEWLSFRAERGIIIVPIEGPAIPRLRRFAAPLGMTATLALPGATPYVRQRGTTFSAKEPNPAMIQHQLLTSMIRKAPMFLGFLGAVRLGTSETAVYAVGGGAP
jgi:hypothetical protein